MYTVYFFFYLDILGKLIIGEDTERSKVADRVELEDDFDRLTVAGVVTPTDPTCTMCPIVKKNRPKEERA